MHAVRIERFGGPEMLGFVEVDCPVTAAGEVLVRIDAAGVGPWDALIRSGRSTLVPADALPVTLGSDIAGVVVEVGSGVEDFAPGDEVFGVTNARFTGGYADFAVAEAGMLARRPRAIEFEQAASVPVVAVTAWQMLFDHAALRAEQSVLVLGASGNVGGFAVQLARAHGIHVTAAGRSDDAERLRTLGADRVVDARAGDRELANVRVDAIVDAVGGDLQRRSLRCLKPGGVLVSAVSSPDASLSRDAGVVGRFFIVDVTTECLVRIAALIDAGALQTRVGAVLPLRQACTAHEMLEGLRPTPPGKIVLVPPQAPSSRPIRSRHELDPFD